MSWLPHPSTWGKKNSKPPSFIPTVSEGTVELLRSMGVKIEEDKKPFPLFEIKVTPVPYPRPLGVLFAEKFQYGANKEIDVIEGKQEDSKGKE